MEEELLETINYLNLHEINQTQSISCLERYHEHLPGVLQKPTGI